MEPNAAQKSATSFEHYHTETAGGDALIFGTFDSMTDHEARPKEHR